MADLIVVTWLTDRRIGHFGDLLEAAAHRIPMRCCVLIPISRNDDDGFQGLEGTVPDPARLRKDVVPYAMRVRHACNAPVADRRCRITA